MKTITYYEKHNYFNSEGKRVTMSEMRNLLSKKIVFKVIDHVTQNDITENIILKVNKANSNKDCTEGERVLWKYKNRKLYDPAIKSQVSFGYIVNLVKENVKFKVIEQKSKVDVTEDVVLHSLSKMLSEQKGNLSMYKGLILLFTKDN